MNETTLFLFFEAIQAIILSLALVFSALTFTNGPFWLIGTIFTTANWCVKKAINTPNIIAHYILLGACIIWVTFKWLVRSLLGIKTFPTRLKVDFKDKHKRISLWQEAATILTLLTACAIAYQLTRIMGFTGNLLESLLYFGCLILLGITTVVACLIQTIQWLKYKVKNNDTNAAAELQELLAGLTELKKLLRDPRA